VERFEYTTEKDTYTFCSNGVKEGGNAFVYKCLKTNNKELAIKVMKRAYISNENKILRFRNEIKILSEISHPNIVEIIDDGKSADNLLFYVMPYYKENLRSKMKSMSNNEKINAFLDICYGVKEIHKKEKVHRDLKPENILFDEKNERFLVADLGILYDPENRITKKSDKLANFDYHAQEQRSKSETDIGFYTDIYALGLMLNELFTGILPKGKNYLKVADISPLYSFLDDIIDTMLLYSVKKRETKIDNVINKIKKSNEIMLNEVQKVADKIGYKKDELYVIEDIYLVNKLINDKNTKWRKFNFSYHPENVFSARRSIIDSIELISLYNKLKTHFTNEPLESQEKFKSYCLDLTNTRDNKMYYQFKDYLDNLNFYEPFQIFKKLCLKYFLCIKEYHAREVNRGLYNFKEKIELNLIDVPLLTVSYYILDIGDEIIEHIGKHIDISDYILFSSKIDLVTDDGDNLYNMLEDHNDKVIAERLNILLDNVTVTKQSFYNYEIIMDLENQEKFKAICDKLAEEIDDESNFKYDLIELDYKCVELDSRVYYRVDGFQYNNVIKRLLDKLEI
jgi:serine/threonine protein kinase